MKFQSEKARLFADLHRRQNGLFVMPNAWNAGSCRMLASEGFAAIGTTSAGIAFSLGRPDYAGAVSREEMLDEVARIVAATDLPVSADLESGYGQMPRDVADTIRLAIEAGVVGANIEDVSPETGQLFAVEEAAERLSAAKAAAQVACPDFVLTGRTDVFLTGEPDALAAAIQRARTYHRAGADCIFVPGVRSASDIRILAEQIPAPLTVVMGFAGATMALSELQQLGVQRVSIGGSLARATFGLIRRAAREIRQQGTFGFADLQIPDGELCQFFNQED
ncbi:isocitrate lyase/PEP mutase family protein [Leeia oryzae]|uniref:isocitrate lyase/PEP mutase family protein n=1 Tax=Leeia oryzae TaxID=356662 RepID=UPI00039C50F7|nr:isocitrate lyase/phosphoenolpyruvate mutase family protein [Leeia oryzae]